MFGLNLSTLSPGPGVPDMGVPLLKPLVDGTNVDA